MIVPLHFQSSSHFLFGVHHAPEPSSALRLGVVLCPPMGREYMRTHLVFFELAEALAREGFNVLRFDYRGTGDSDGDCEDGTVEQWVRDIGSAIEELRNRTGVQETCLVGHRLGGALAALHCLREKNVSHLVLSRPVLSGERYLTDILDSHQEWLRGSFADSKRNREGQEIQGFPLNEALKLELSQIDLLDLSEPIAKRILAIERSPKPEDYEDFATSQRQLGSTVESRVMTKEEIQREQTLTIVSWLKECARS